MPKQRPVYAVRRGKSGHPHILHSVDQVMLEIDGHPQAWFKSFENEGAAREFLALDSPAAKRYNPYLIATSQASSGKSLSSTSANYQSRLTGSSTSSCKKAPVDLGSPPPRPAHKASTVQEVICLSSDPIDEISPVKPLKSKKARLTNTSALRPTFTIRSPPSSQPSSKSFLSTPSNDAYLSDKKNAFPDSDEEEAMKHTSLDCNDIQDHSNFLRKSLSTQVPIPSTSRHSMDVLDVNEKASMELTDDQQKILTLAIAGDSVFYTGSAGTGKSVLLRAIIKELKKGMHKEQLYITASTGMAAVNIGEGATTLHSFAGVGLAKEPAEKLVSKLSAKAGNLAKSRSRWQNARILIIDEISMVDGVFFDKLEYIARQLRYSPEPFGGLQVIATGDFFQLPPVPDYHGGTSKKSCFAFNAKSWNSVFPKVYSLRTVFRQTDHRFVDLLTKMRMGVNTNETISIMKSLHRKVEYTDGIEPTHLTALRKEVDAENAERLHALPGPSKMFPAKDNKGQVAIEKGLSDKEVTEKLDKNTLIPSCLELRVGCQVMLVKNLQECALVNGSVGLVIGYCSAAEVVRKEEFEDYSEDTQIQIAKAEERIKQKDPGPSYDKVALSYKDRDKAGGADIPAGEWPIVEFKSALTGHKSRLLIPPMDFTVEDPDGKIDCSRTGVPLILSWCLSIHKSQGQTIERLLVDLGSVFEKGQAYVAVSRGVSLDTLEVRNFNPSRVMVHPEVIDWAKRLL